MPKHKNEFPMIPVTVLRKILTAAILGIITLITGCGKKPIEITGFSKDAWQADKLACKGERSLLVGSLRAEKDKLKGSTDYELTQLLGKPEGVGIEKRNKHTLIWYVKQGPQCEGKNGGSYLEVRFNAVNLSNELLLIENGMEQAF